MSNRIDGLSTTMTVLPGSMLMVGIGLLFTALKRAWVPALIGCSEPLGLPQGRKSSILPPAIRLSIAAKCASRLKTA